MDKDLYRQMNEQITPSEELIRRTCDAAAPSRPPWRPLRILPAALCLLLAALLGTALAQTSFVAGLIDRVFPDSAHDFTPVYRSCEAQGITLEVLQAQLINGGANIVFRLRGEGINHHTRIYAAVEAAGSTKVEYGRLMSSGTPDEPDTAYFIIFQAGSSLFPGESGSLSPGDEVTLRLYGATIYNDGGGTAHQELDLCSFSDDPALHDVTAQQIIFPAPGSEDDTFHFLEPAIHAVLLPGEPVLTLPHDLCITAAGFVDGQLHVQTRLPVRKITQEYMGRTYTSDAPDSFSVSLGPRDAIDLTDEDFLQKEYTLTWTDAEGLYSYTEHVFRPEKEELANCMLNSIWHVTGDYASGDWAVTFPLTQAE